MSELFETANRIYMKVFGHGYLDDEQPFKTAKLQEINDWFEAGDLGRMTVAELIEAWIEHDVHDVSWYGSASTDSTKAVGAGRNDLYRLMLRGDRIRHFGAFMSGDDAPSVARFAEFAKLQPLGAKWGYARFAGWMIETYPAEVESWRAADSGV